MGLTGDSEAIRKAALAYKVFYVKTAGASSGDYTIDHTAFIYLIGPTAVSRVPSTQLAILIGCTGASTTSVSRQLPLRR
jgi:cytochrome oxidase Cu insertion factor (SCO1/SenC/PrrC family)